MKSDQELFEMIVGTMEAMCGDALDVPAQDYFGDDVLPEEDRLTDEEFERLAVIKEHISMQMMEGNNMAVIVIRWDSNEDKD